MTIIAELKHVSKSFGKITALDDLSFTVERGAATALLGPNGAGKSTALNILQGLRMPDNGEATLFDLASGNPEAMSKIGVTPQQADFPPQMTTIELLNFTRAHFREPHELDYLVVNFNLGKLADRRVSGFSGGEKRRLALAMCFAGNPQLAILDEPTSGLDTEGQAEFQFYAKEFIAGGGSLVLSSHYWQEIEAVASRV